MEHILIQTILGSSIQLQFFLKELDELQKKSMQTILIWTWILLEILMSYVNFWWLIFVH